MRRLALIVLFVFLASAPVAAGELKPIFDSAFLQVIE
jgi:hypothetical protein